MRAWLQLQAKDQAAALYQQQTVQQKEMLQAAAEREAELQAQLGDMRSQIGDTSAVLENHLQNYAQYQQAIDRSNEVCISSVSCWACDHLLLFRQVEDAASSTSRIFMLLDSDNCPTAFKLRNRCIECP